MLTSATAVIPTRSPDDNNEDGSDNEAESKAETEEKEIRVYDEVYKYLSNGIYPRDATKAEKDVIRKRAKTFRIIDGILHYRGKKGLRQVCASAMIHTYIHTYIQCT